MVENEFLSKRRRGRPKKTASAAATQLEKNNLPNHWEEDFIFPVFDQPSEKIAVHQSKLKNISLAHHSPHLLDLKNKNHYAPENYYSADSRTTTDHSSDWARNLVNFTHQIESPSEPTAHKNSTKNTFHQPKKIKKPYYTKLNLGKGFINYAPASKNILYLLNKLFLWRLFKKIITIFWQVITFPFRALDFLVDLILKTIWYLIKFFFLTLGHIFLSFFKNLKKLFSFRRPVASLTKTFSPSRHFKFHFKPIFSFILVALLIIAPLQIINWQKNSAGLKGAVLGQSISGLNSLKQALNWSSQGQFVQANQEFDNAYFNFNEAQKSVNNLNLFTQQIIKLVPEAREGENLLRLGQLSATLGKKLTDSTLPASQETPTFINKIISLNKSLNEIEPLIKEINSRLNNTSISVLKKYLTTEEINQLIALQKTVSILTANLDNLKTLSIFFTNFLGVERPQQYLLIFENNAEIRPTGGFMGSFALMEINQGKIIRMEVPGGGFYDLKAVTQTTVEAPKPFQLFSPLWQIWNANWFPDWSASAKKISWFYEKTLIGVTVDGVIAITPDLLIDFLKITGPIEMPAYKKTITAENFMTEVQMAVEIEYDKTLNQPKKIIADMMPEILNRLFHLPAAQITPWLQSLLTNANQKNILLWFRNEQMQAVAENLALTGTIKQTPNDYLMIVHTNIGGGKTDRVIKNKISYEVRANEKGELIATLNLIRQHNGDVKNIFENQNNVDFIRFYVPEGSALISATGFDTLPATLFKTADFHVDKDSDLLALEKNPLIDENTGTRITTEFNKTVFGNWLMVMPGQEKKVTLTYRLPFNLTATQPNRWQKILNFFQAASQPTDFNYQLLIQKQPGVIDTEIISSFIAPENWSLTNNSSAVVNISGSTASFNNDLKEDTAYGLKIQPAP